MGRMNSAKVERVRAVRERITREGPPWTRDIEGDFERVALPARDADLLRDLLIGERVRTVIEVGLAYAGSALAIGEALLTVDAPNPVHVVIDPYQGEAYEDVGWNLLCEAGLDSIATLVTEPSSVALPRLAYPKAEEADAAFVDGSHRFHDLMVDLYFLRQIIRPGGLIVVDDYDRPSVRSAVSYFERNLDWSPLRAEGRCRVLRLPDPPVEPPFEDFTPF